MCHTGPWSPPEPPAPSTVAADGRTADLIDHQVIPGRSAAAPLHVPVYVKRLPDGYDPDGPGPMVTPIKEWGVCLFLTHEIPGGREVTAEIPHRARWDAAAGAWGRCACQAPCMADPPAMPRAMSDDEMRDRIARMEAEGEL